MNLLALIPFPWRLLALALFAAALCGFGYVKGLHHGEVELASYRGTVELAAAEQEKAIALIDLRDVHRQRLDAALSRLPI